MKLWKNGAFLRGKSDEGNILALVLIMVIFLSLWLSSVFLFTSSAHMAQTKNITQSQSKEAAVNSAIEQTLAIINNTSAKGLGKLLGDVTTTGADCSTVAFPDYVAPDGTTISVKCSQSATSGSNGPLASIVLTGTCTTGPNCQTGTSAGISVINDGSSCPTPINLAGGSLSVSPATVGFNDTKCLLVSLSAAPGQASPIIATQTAPTSTPCVQNANTSGTVCSSKTDSGAQTKIDEDTYDLTLHGTDIDSNESHTKTVDSSNLAVFDDGFDPAANTPASFVCPTKTVNISWPTKLGTNHVDRFANLNTASIQHLTALSSSACKATIIFAPGTYRFNNDVSGTDATSDAANPTSGSEWYIQSGTVIGGTSTNSNGDCDTTKSGVQFQFNKDTFVRQNAAKVYLCGISLDSKKRLPVIYAPRYSETVGSHKYANFYWSALRSHNGASTPTNALWTMENTVAQAGSYNPETDTRASDYARFHTGYNHDGDEAFETWSVSDQQAYAKALHHNDRSELSSSEKEHAKSAMNNTKFSDGSENHYTVSSCLECLTVHGSWFSPSAAVSFYSSTVSKWVIEKGMTVLALNVHLKDKGGNVLPTAAGNYRDGRVVQLFLTNKSTGARTTVTEYVNDGSGRKPASKTTMVSLSNYNKN